MKLYLFLGSQGPGVRTSVSRICQILLAIGTEPYNLRRDRGTSSRLCKKPGRCTITGKTDVAMVNETLCKILCQNLAVRIHEMCDLAKLD
jgi:hypothetical protein